MRPRWWRSKRRSESTAWPTKGTLEVGKLADLVILERNPLTVDPATIKDIAVLETIKEGRSIYRRPAGVTAASQVRAWPAHSHVPAAEPLTPVARDTLALLLQAAR